MSFFDTLKSMGLFQGGQRAPQGQPQQPQGNPYGLDPALLRQAQLASLGSIGGQIMALSQQMTPAQRAAMMSRADWTGGLQNNLANMSQMQQAAMQQRQQQEQQARVEQARVQLAEMIKKTPPGQRRDAAMFYLQAGDIENAGKVLFTPASSEAPQMKTIRVGDKDVTYQWDATQNRWVKFGEGEAFKPTPDTVVNNNVGTGGGTEDFDKKLMGGIGDAYVTAYNAGAPAQETLTAVQQLRTLLQENGGALDGFAAAISPYVPAEWLPEGANDLVAAQSIVAGLIPKQRLPGAGSTSDYDARMFAQSLPSIWNKPGANEIILNTIEAYSQYRLAVSNIIADVAADPSIQNKSGAIREAIKALPDPFEQWKQARRSIGGGAPQQVPGGGKGDFAGSDLESALEEYK